MSLTRIFQPTKLTLHQQLLLDKPASHHVATVLRMRVGDKLYIFNGESMGDYQASITQISKQVVTVNITDFVTKHTESSLKLCLAQGIARGEKMDFIIQKAVELGVNAIYPLVTERCNVKLDVTRAEKKVLHWRSVIISACEQSGRQCIPNIFPMVPLEDWLNLSRNGACFVLSPQGNHSLKSITPTPETVTLLVGPEGGLSNAEIQNAIHHGFNPLTLGPRIMRTETAGIAALAIFQSIYGDLG